MFQRRMIAGLLAGTALALVSVDAQAQGRVSIYTAHNSSIVERLIPEFEKSTGIKADVVKAGSGDIIKRVNAEKNNPQADVIWSIGAELLEANAELLAPYTPKEADKIAPNYRTTSPWIPYNGIVNVFVVNTAKLKPEEYPKSWADLANPRFKGQISAAGADKSGSAYMQLATFLKIYGDDKAGWDKYEAVLKNIKISSSSGAVSRFVNDGEALVGLTLEDNAYLYVKGGGPVAIVYPEDGTSAIADGMALVKGAPNAEGGKAFIDWALSLPVQDLIDAELGRRPIRVDGTPPAGLKPAAEIKLIDYQIPWAAQMRDGYIKKWNDLVLMR